MTEIRPLKREDLDEVAHLYELVMREGAPTPPPFLVGFFEQTLLDHPWADPEISSLVCRTEGGELIGFLGSNTRRMRFDGQPIRMGCCAHLLTHPRARNRAVVGAQLVRTYFAGPQELTITDGATEAVRRMWEAVGGQTVHASCLTFVQPFRPWQLASGRLAERFGYGLDTVLGPISRGLDAGTARIFGRALRLAEPEGTVEALTPQAMLEHLPVVSESLRLRPDYDAKYLKWLFGVLADVEEWGTLWERGVRRGPLWAQLVRRYGRVLGWYVCHLRRGGFCRLLQLAASDREVGTVFDHLAYQSMQAGAAGLYGRLEPRLVGPLSERRTWVRFHEGRLVAYSPREEIVSSILSGKALLTRLDGEWW